MIILKLHVLLYHFNLEEKKLQRNIHFLTNPIHAHQPLYELRNHVLHKAILIEKNTKKHFVSFSIFQRKIWRILDNHGNYSFH